MGLQRVSIQPDYSKPAMEFRFHNHSQYVSHDSIQLFHLPTEHSTQNIQIWVCLSTFVAWICVVSPKKQGGLGLTVGIQINKKLAKHEETTGTCLNPKGCSWTHNYFKKKGRRLTPLGFCSHRIYVWYIYLHLL